MDREKVKRDNNKIWATGKKWMKGQGLSGSEKQSELLCPAVQVVHCPNLVDTAYSDSKVKAFFRVVLSIACTAASHSPEEKTSAKWPWGKREPSQFAKSQGLKVPGGSGEEDKWEGSAHTQLKMGYRYRYRCGCGLDVVINIGIDTGIPQPRMCFVVMWGRDPILPFFLND